MGMTSGIRGRHGGLWAVPKNAYFPVDIEKGSLRNVTLSNIYYSLSAESAIIMYIKLVLASE
jgi:hypothetical protein